MRDRLAILVLLLGVAHEFVWQAWPDELQGDIEIITRWPLICSLCFALGRISGNRNLQAACAAVATFSITTAACSLWWLIEPWPMLPGGEQCSKKWGPLSLLVSGLAACLVLAYWRWADHGPKPR